MVKANFCSNCGTKLNPDAKFCFNCGFEINKNDINDKNDKNISSQNDLYNQYNIIIFTKVIEAHIRDIKLPIDILYQNGNNYNISREQIREMIVACEESIDKFETFLKSLYINGTLLMLDISDEMKEECINYAENIGIDYDYADDLYENFISKNKIKGKAVILMGQLLVYGEGGDVMSLEEFPENKEMGDNSYYKRFIEALLSMENSQDELHKKSGSLELSESDINKMYEKGESLGFRNFEHIDFCIDGAEIKLGYAEKAQKQNNERMFEDIIPAKKITLFGKEILFGSNYFFKDYLNENLGKEFEKNKLKFMAIMRKSCSEESLRNENFDLQIDRWSESIKLIWEKTVFNFIEDLPINSEDKEELCENISDKFFETFETLDKKLYDVNSIVEAIDCGVAVTELEGNIKKAFRGSWAGGGIGIKGAVKGAVAATVLNAGTGLVYDAVNAISRSSAKNKAVKQKEEILKNALKMIEDFINYVSKVTPDRLLLCISELYPFSYIDENKDEFEKVYKNYSKQKDEMHKKNICTELLALQPKNEKVYVLTAKHILSETESEKKKDTDAFLEVLECFKINKLRVLNLLAEEAVNNYRPNDIKRCETLIEIENLFQSKDERKRKEVFDAFLSKSKTTNFGQYTFDELYSVIKAVKTFGTKFSYSVNELQKSLLEKYMSHHIKSLTEYSYNEFESLIDMMNSVAKTFLYPVEDAKNSLFANYVKYHIKNGLEKYTAEEINSLTEKIDWLSEKFSYEINDAKKQIFAEIFKHYGIDLKTTDEEILKRNINDLTYLEENCRLDFDLFIKKQKEKLTDLLNKKDTDSKTVGDVLYDSIDEASAAREEMLTIEHIYEDIALNDTAKFKKLILNEFKTKQAKDVVISKERSLINHIAFCKENTKHRSSFGWFVFYLFLTPIAGIVGLAFSIIGIIVALCVIGGLWINYSEKRKEVKEDNERADKYKAEIAEFNRTFKIENGRIILK